MSRTVCRIVFVSCVAASAAVAQAAAVSLGTVRITQPVLVDGERLAAGAYEVRLTGEYLPAQPGQSPDSLPVVELVKGGQVVAHYAAEVVDKPVKAVGTSGRAGSTRPVVQKLKGDEFLRIAAMREGKEYLIHLPLAR